MRVTTPKIPSEVAFTAVALGRSIVHNRIGLAPMNTGMINDAGLPTEDFEIFHALYAASGVGLVFIGGVGVSPRARASRRSLSLDSPEKADQLKSTIDKVIGYGALPIIQLMHAGRQSSLPGDLFAASALPSAVSPRLPIELSVPQIKTITEQFGRAAQLAKQAGIQLIELHSAHGYLLSDFLSPSLNRRHDGYGGTAENRFRFLRETIECVKQVAGLGVGVRLNGKENVSDGIQESDLVDLVKRVEEAGAKYVSISAGVYNRPDLIMPDRQNGEAVYRELGRIAKSATTIPVILAGNIASIDTVNDLILSGAADVALMGRALLADPKLVEEYKEGRGPSACCTMRLICKYNSHQLPQISCPHNRQLRSQLSARVKERRPGGR